MNDATEKSEDPRAAAQASATPPLDPGETRAVILAAAALAVFLYFIKLILLPFVLAAIVAYICTGPLDWIAKRTGCYERHNLKVVEMRFKSGQTVEGVEQLWLIDLQVARRIH